MLDNVATIIIIYQLNTTIYITKAQMNNGRLMLLRQRPPFRSLCHSRMAGSFLPDGKLLAFFAPAVTL
jgi:hypothetical protein